MIDNHRVVNMVQLSFVNKWPIGTLNLVLTLTAFQIAIDKTVAHINDLGDLDLYKISWKGPLMTSATFNNFNQDNIIDISTKNKERYKCVVPDDKDHLNFDTSAKNSSSDESSSSSQQTSPIQVLEPLLKSNFCSYKFELFWVYELCHGKFLRQYHEENTKLKTKITQEYYLGRLEQEKIAEHQEEYEREKLELEKSGNSQDSRPTISINGQYKPYVMLNMTGGTKCDLTKKDRVTRILYVCNEEPKHELFSIKEISTCEYEAIVLTPTLCLHKDYKVDANTQHEIQCFSIGNSPRKPINSIDSVEIEEDDEDDDDVKNKDKHQRRGVAYFQGRTLIIDADLILS